MKSFELAVAGILACLAIRSLVHWVRAPYESGRISDLALYAAFVTGRVGMWIVLAGTFTLYALDASNPESSGVGPNRQWLSLVFLVLGGTQLVASYLLNQRTKGR